MTFDPTTYTPVFPANAKESGKSVKSDTAVTKTELVDATAPEVHLADVAAKDWWDSFSQGAMSAIDTYNYQVGSGVRGMAQLVVPSDSKVGQALKTINQTEKTAAEQARVANPKAAFIGDAAGIATDIAFKTALGSGIGAAGTALAPGAAAGLSELATQSPKAVAIGKSALQGGAYGASQFADTGEDRAKNTALGAALSGAATGAYQGAKTLAGKAFAKAPGETTQQAIEKGKDVLENANGTLGQVLNRPSVQAAEQIGTKIPVVGTRGAVEEQRKVLENLTTSFEKKVGDVPKSALSTKAPEGIAESAQYHINKTMTKLSDQTSALYDKFDKAAGKATDKMPIPKAQEQAQRLLAQQNGLFNLPGGDDIAKVAETLSTTKALNPSLLKQANKFLSTAYEKTVKVSDTAARDILKVKSALNADTSAFAKSQGGEIAKLYTNASKFAAENKMPYKNNILVSKVISGQIEPDKIMSQLIKPDQPQFLREILKPMTPEARGSIRNSILTTLHEKASSTGTFNPIQYNQDLGKVMTTMKGALNGSQYKELAGIKKYFDVTEANQKMLNTSPLFPGYLATSAFATGMATNPLLTAGITGSVAGISKLLTGKPLSKLLIKLADTTSKEGQEAIKRLITRNVTKNITTKAATNSATSPTDDKPSINYLLK